jgi:AcrR family transcriptional regulator
VSSTIAAVTVPAPPWRTPKKAARQPLSADLVLATALRIVDKDGLDGLSMRRVAQELGTGAASLYAYFASKEELLEQLLDRVIGAVPIAAVEPGRWVEQLKELHINSRAVLRAHRDLARAAQANIPVGPNSLRVTEHALALLRAGGVPDRYAAFAVDKLAMIVVADVVEGAMYQAQEHGADDLKRIRDYFASLPPDQFPNLVSMADTLFEGEGDQRFLFSLDLMVDGLAALAVRS